MTEPRLLWDWGTAYDLFTSLEVLHRPASFGLRPSWAAGVRARIPPSEREILAESQFFSHGPLAWAHTLPAPKDGTTALGVLAQAPAAQRLALLAFTYDWPPAGVRDVVLNVSDRGQWDAHDRDLLRAAYHGRGCQKGLSAPEPLDAMLEWWARPEEAGERYLEALKVYQQVFFAEEERRIRPALQAALARAQTLAQQRPLAELLEELSHGLRFEEPLDLAEVVLVPSYWTTPLVGFGRVTPDREIWLFGARPADASLVPGQEVPDALLGTLKALADPTRLRILQYLAHERLSPAELARRLRLRTPTVIHHLDILRLAGLVQLTIDMGTDRESRYYAARLAEVDAASDALQSFLSTRTEG